MLEAGAIDDSDLVFWDGEVVGQSIAAWDRARSHAVPAAKAKPGRHVLCVLVHDSGGEGGFAATRSGCVLATGTACTSPHGLRC